MAVRCSALLDLGFGKSMNFIAWTPICTRHNYVIELLANHGRMVRENKQSEESATAREMIAGMLRRYREQTKHPSRILAQYQVRLQQLQHHAAGSWNVNVETITERVQIA